MLGGLYGDLPPPSSAADDDKPGNQSSTTSTTAAAVWSSSVKMAPPTLRKPAYTPPPSVLRSQSNLTKPKPNPKTLTPIPLPLDDHPSPPRSLAQPALVGVTSSLVDEYDPAFPNHYEDYKREKKRRAREAEVRRELERRQLEEEERERERERDRDRIGNNTPSSAAVNNSISGEEAWRRRTAMSGGNGGAPARSPSPTPVGSGSGGGGGGGGDGGGFSIGKSDTVGLGVGAGGQMTTAQRMMAKMGWKEGQGLGKLEQGITTPLMAKKTDRRAGVIVNASEKKKQQQQLQEQQELEKKMVKGVTFNGTPTRVLLLRNMVGPGEVDDELEDEVGSECAKYGTVTRVLIFEITEPNFPSTEAVRIFIQFERPEETTKAYVDLDGRFFGGRVVRAAFYDEDRFSKNELAPLPGEVAGF